MSVDLMRGMKQRTPRQRRGRVATIRRDATRKRKLITDWPRADIFDSFIDLESEDLYDNLINYRLTLDPFSATKEIRAITSITQKLPWPLVKKFFQYMKQRNAQTFATTFKKFVENRNVKEAIEKADRIIKSRQAEPLGVYVSKPPGFLKRESSNSIEAAGTKQCLSKYKHATWASAVVGEPIVVTEMVMRKKILTPGTQTSPGLTNERWLDEEVKRGWYSLNSSWYETVCRFGRPWRENTVGYLLEDGRILEEDKRLYDASVKFFFSSEKVSISCIADYRTAPWAQGVSKSDVHKIVARNSPETQNYLKTRVKGDWYTLSTAWYRKVCREGRPFIPGVMGYLLKNGKIIDETKNLYTFAASYLSSIESAGVGSRRRAEISTLCVNDLLSPTWVKSALGVSPVRMVALDSPETRNWIVPTPIQGTHWYNLKRSWYINVCDNGREWIPGAYGYRMASGQIFPETREMYESYLDMFERKREIGSDDLPGDKIYETVGKILAEVLPQDDVDELIQHLPSNSVGDLVDSAAKIYVFASKLINKPQVHLERIKNGQLPMRILPMLKKDMMLPEVFKNPALNPDTAERGVLTWNDYDERIGTRINTVKDRMIKGTNDEVAMRRKASLREKVIPLKSQVDRCSNDPVYYMEDNKMFCFDRRSLQGLTKNPKTGKNFNKNFLKFLSHIKNFSAEEPEEMEIDEYPALEEEEEGREVPRRVAHKRKRTTVLAPGLLKSVKRDISSSSYNFGGGRRRSAVKMMHSSSPETVYCAKCNKTFADPKFKTIFKGNIVNFCTTKCFEEFRFK